MLLIRLSVVWSFKAADRIGFWRSIWLRSWCRSGAGLLKICETGIKVIGIALIRSRFGAQHCSATRAVAHAFLDIDSLGGRIPQRLMSVWRKSGGIMESF